MQMVGAGVDAPAPCHSPEKDQQAMTALQYRAACNKLGLTTYRAMAKELGISKDSAHRYAKGQWDVPETVAKLLRALVALGTTEI